jgi:hypothetical protein
MTSLKAVRMRSEALKDKEQLLVSCARIDERMRSFNKLEPHTGWPATVLYRLKPFLYCRRSRLHSMSAADNIRRNGRVHLTTCPRSRVPKRESQLLS